MLLDYEFQTPSLEIHIPISPTEYYFNMIHYFARSLRLNGGACNSARIVVTVGDHKTDTSILSKYPWLEPLGIEVAWVDPVDFDKDSYFATGYQRWVHDFRSDVVIMMDADMLVVGDLGDVVHAIDREQVLGGVIAHKSPFRFSKYWKDPLFKAFGIEDLRLECEHTGWGAMFAEEDLRYCPPYFNFGFVIAPTSIIRRIGAEFRAIFDVVRNTLNSSFWGQMTLSVAIVKMSIPYKLLEMRYNFANVPAIETKYADELEEARVLHLLYPGEFNREEVFASIGSVEEMLNRTDFTGVNAIAQDTVRKIHPLVKGDRAR